MKIPPDIAARIEAEIAKLTSKGRGHIDHEVQGTAFSLACGDFGWRLPLGEDPSP